MQAIGALATSQSDPNTVWAGTGEAWAIRDADVVGDGVYKSTDAGVNWTNMGLKETGRRLDALIHSDESMHRLCLYAGSLDRAGEGERLSHDGWRRDVESRPVRRSKHGVPVYESLDPGRIPKTFVAYVVAGDAHLEDRERRRGQRRLHLARRRDLERRTGLPTSSCGKGRRRHRTVQSSSRIFAAWSRPIPGITVANRRTPGADAWKSVTTPAR